jgi:hypothetical protein
MLEPFAFIDPSREADVHKSDDGYDAIKQFDHLVQHVLLNDPYVTAEIDDDRIALHRKSVTEQGFALTLNDVRVAISVLKYVASWRACRLTWRTSEIVVESDMAGTLLTRWAETNEPPILNIVRICWDHSEATPETLTTLGLFPFVRQEIRVQFHPPHGDHYAARTLARLARHALMEGPIADGHKFAGIDGETLCAKHVHDNAAGTMINVRL